MTEPPPPAGATNSHSAPRRATGKLSNHPRRGSRSDLCTGADVGDAASGVTVGGVSTGADVGGTASLGSAGRQGNRRREDPCDERTAKHRSQSRNANSAWSGCLVLAIIVGLIFGGCQMCGLVVYRSAWTVSATRSARIFAAGLRQRSYHEGERATCVVTQPFALARIHRRTPMDGVRAAEGGG